MWREGHTADGRHYHESRREFRSEMRGSDDGRRGDHHKKQHGEREEGDYIAPRGYGGEYGEERRETFEERRHERGESELQPSYNLASARRRT
jgi:hypothetical protein